MARRPTKKVARKKAPARAKMAAKAETAIDIVALANQQRQLRGGGWYKMETDRIRIRPIPFQHNGKGTLFTTERRHFNVHPDYMVLPCLATDDGIGKCPICKLQFVTPDKNQRMILRSSTKYPMLIVLQGPGTNSKILKWRTPYAVIDAITDVVLDIDEYPNALSFSNGYDFIVTRKGSGRGTRYSAKIASKRTSVVPEGELTDLMELSEKAMERMLADVDLDKIAFEVAESWD